MADKVMALIACVLVGGGFLLYALVKATKVSVSLKWPQVTGSITESKVETNTDADDDPYAVSIKYEYVVNGATQACLQEMGTFVRKSSAQACADRYAVNSKVVVYYDPEKPADAVLEPAYTKAILALAAGIVFALLGARLAFELRPH